MFATMDSDGESSGGRGNPFHARLEMIRLSRFVIVAGAAVTFAACSDNVSTAPRLAPAAAASGDHVVLSAPTTSTSCTVTQTSTGYDVTITWSGLSATGLELWQTGGTQPLTQSTFPHKTHSGSWTGTVQTPPDYALLTTRQSRTRVTC